MRNALKLTGSAATIESMLPPVVYDDLYVVMDLTGVFIFALSGGLAGRRAGLDFFGVVVVGSLTGIGGGIMRDLLIGDIPPASLTDWRYILIAIVGAMVPLLFSPSSQRALTWLLVLDAFGLALFAVASSSKAFHYGVTPIAAPLIGVLAATGGGALRDVLSNEIPIILRREIYALAALAGGVLITVALYLEWPPIPLGITAFVVVVALRLISLRYKWRSPLQQEEPELL